MSRKLLMSLFVVFGIGSLLLFGCSNQDVSSVNEDVLLGEWNIVADVNLGVTDFKNATVTFNEEEFTYNNETQEYKIKNNHVTLGNLGTYEIKEEGNDSLRLYREKDCYLQLVKGQLTDVELSGKYHVNFRVSTDYIDEDVEFSDVFTDYRNGEVFVTSAYEIKDHVLTVTDLNKSFYTYKNNETVLLVETDSAFVWELIK